MFYDDDLTKIIDEYAHPAARAVDANGEFPKASINAWQSVRPARHHGASEEFGGGGSVMFIDAIEVKIRRRGRQAPAWLGLGVTVAASKTI